MVRDKMALQFPENKQHSKLKKKRINKFSGSKLVTVQKNQILLNLLCWGRYARFVGEDKVMDPKLIG